MGLCGYKLCDQSSTIPFLLGGGKAHWTFQMDYSGWVTVGKQQINELRMELRYLDHWAFSVSHSICGGGCGGFAREEYAVGKLVTKVNIRTNLCMYNCRHMSDSYSKSNRHSNCAVTVTDIHAHIHAWAGMHTHTRRHTKSWTQASIVLCSHEIGSQRFFSISTNKGSRAGEEKLKKKKKKKKRRTEIWANTKSLWGSQDC